MKIEQRTTVIGETKKNIYQILPEPDHPNALGGLDTAYRLMLKWTVTRRQYAKALQEQVEVQIVNIQE